MQEEYRALGVDGKIDPEMIAKHIAESRRFDCFKDHPSLASEIFHIRVID